MAKQNAIITIGSVYVIKINGIWYEVINDPDFEYKVKYALENPAKITYNIENDYECIMLSRNSGLINNAEYLKFLGKITAKDEYGNDISAGVGIYSPLTKENAKSNINTVYIYISDANDNAIAIPLKMYITKWHDDITYDENSFIGGHYERLSEHPLVYGRLRNAMSLNSNTSSKKLELVK